MTKLSDLIPEVARLLDAPFHDETVSVFARHLRLARLLSTAGRGRGGADMTPADCTNLVLAPLSGFPAKDAAEAVAVYRGLKSNGAWRRDEGAPRASWLDELEGSSLGVILDRLFAAAMTDDFSKLEKDALAATTAGNWYLFVRIMSPKPAAEILIGAGVPQFAGELRKYNKIIAAMDFREGAKTVDIDDTRTTEEFAAAQRGWTSDRVRSETISRGTVKHLGALLAAKDVK